MNKSVRQLVALLSAIICAFSSLSCEMVEAAEQTVKTAANSLIQKHDTSGPTIKKKSFAELTRPIARISNFSNNPTDLELFNARVFSNPMIPMDGTASSGENIELAKALSNFRKRANAEDRSDLIAFIEQHPKSRWLPALQVGLGEKSLESGYLTDALKYWASAWDESKRQTALQRKAVADTAISNLVLLEARLGLMESLSKHLSEVQKRTLTGSVQQKVNDARSGLFSMRACPEKSFRCGPLALSTLAYLKSPKGDMEMEKTSRKALSTSKGTNLAQVFDWSEQMHLNLQMCKRDPGAKFVTPALMHWKVGHFAAVTATKDERYRVQDPTFGAKSNMWLSAKALDAQTDGYFLAPKGKLPLGWHSIQRKDAEKVWGKGNAGGQDPGKPPSWPKNCPLGDGTCCPGMPVASAFSMNASLNISDIPLTYQPPVGPAMDMLVNYSYNEGNQPSVFTFTNLGPDWSFYWLSYLTVDSSSNVTISTRGGGFETYNYSGGYSPNLTSQAQVVNLGGGSWQRIMPDGSAENYTLSDGTYTYLTSATDAQGNAVTLSYDGNFRLTGITDACGNAATTISYVSNTLGNAGFYKIATITDGFGRSASFGYDSTTTFLTSITDAAGNVSKFNYDPSSSFINMMTTPYGSTGFQQYMPQGGSPSYPPVGLKFTFPDGSTSVIENWIGEQKETYFWNREATALYPWDPKNLDYRHCNSTRWLWEQSTNLEAPVANWTRPALEAPTIYIYPGELYQDFCGTSNQPTQIIRQLSGFRETATIGGSITPGQQLGLRITDNSLLWSAPDSAYCADVAYTLQAGDTLSTAAAGLAAAINSNFSLQAYGITATSASNVVTVLSNSTNPTSYTVTLSGSASIALAAGPNLAETNTIGGSATAGDVLTMTVFDTGLSGGQQSVNYTVQTGDTLATIAQALSLAVNANANLQAIGLSAAWYTPTWMPSTSPQVSIQSNSTNPTTYTVSVSSGASETMTLASSSNGLTQQSNYQRNALGYITQSIDPMGRVLQYNYASNNIDLLNIQCPSSPSNFYLGQWQYSDPSVPHKPTLSINGSGQKTTFTYNSLAELATTTDALGSTTTLSYNSNGYLSQIQGPLSGSNDVTNYTFYGFGQPHTITNSQGYQLAYGYDNLNRLTSVTYPDGTAERTIYSKLDAVLQGDRIGRWTQSSYNNLDQLVSVSDPLGRTTKYCWCLCGSLASLTDPANNTTTWHHDLEGRIVQKVYADQSTVNYVYQPTTALLASRTDALNQTISFDYNVDNTVQYKLYSNAVHATSPVATSYDPTYKRMTSISNGWGSYSYSYNPYAGSANNQAYVYIGGYPQTPNATDTISLIFNNSALSGGTYSMPSYSVLSGDAGDPSSVATHLASTINANTTLNSAGISATANGTLLTVSAGSTITVTPSATGNTTATVGGGGRLSQITNSVLTGAPVTYSFDALDRTVNRMINGGNNNDSWSYDAMNRVTSESNKLGTFGYSYVDDTPGSSKGDTRLASINYPNSQLTKFSYLPTFQDERLQQIVNLDPSAAVLSQFNYAFDAQGQIKQWQQQQNSTNVHQSLAYDLAGQLIAATNDSGSSFNAYVSGTIHAGDVVSITAYDASLTGSSPPGQETASYTVLSTDTASSIASSLSTSINSTFSNISATASATGTVIAISTSPSYCTQFTCAVSGAGATDTISLSGSTPVQNLHKQLYYSYDCAGNRIGVQGDSSGSFPTGLTTGSTQYAYNNLNELTGAAAGGPIVLKATTTNPVRTAVVNVTLVATIGGSVTIGDKLWLSVHDAGLTHAENVSYSVHSGDTLSSIAAGLASAINADSGLSSLGVSATSSGAAVTLSSASVNITSYSQAVTSGATETITLGTSSGTTATIRPATSFVGSPVLSSGANNVLVTATSGGGTKTTNSYPVTVSSSTPQTFSFDANGNMISDGTNTYLWDAQDRLIQINYSATSSTNISYDAEGHYCQIVETSSGVVQSTNNLVWCGDKLCEARLASGALWAQYFSLGEVSFSGGTNKYFYNKDHLGSVREMTNNSGSILEQFSYDPWGISSLLQGYLTPTFGFTGLYAHKRSGLNLAVYRAYSSTLGRWINRDPIEQEGGINLYAYVENDPADAVDPDGTVLNEINPWGPIFSPQQPTPAPTPGPAPLRGYCQMGGGGLHASGGGDDSGDDNNDGGGGGDGGGGTPGGGNAGRKIGRGSGGGGGGGNPFQKKKKPNTLEEYWEEHHPDYGWGPHRRYTSNGDIRSVQTYDQFGRRYARFDFKDRFGKAEHRENRTYGPGRNTGERFNHLPIDEITE
jgi:RHS repeat-associated protein